MSPALRTWKWIVLTTFLLGFPALLSAQFGPVAQNGEYPISGPMNGDQTSSRVAIGASGGFVVGQDNGIDGNGFGIFGRRLGADLSPVGVPFRVNEVTAGDQEKPSIALLNNGGAIVAWQGGRQGFQNISARFLNADGSFATGDVVVNGVARTTTQRITTNWMVFRNNRVKYRTQRIKQIITEKRERTGGAAVASLSDGTVVVAYASARRAHEKIQTMVNRVRFIHNRFITNSVLQFVESDSGDMQDVYFQLLSQTGAKIGGEVRANQFTPFNQNQPAIAALADGTFVLTWNSDQQTAADTIDVVARRFDGRGNPLSDELVVNGVSRPCGPPAVAGHTEGGFTIVWAQKTEVRTNSLDIFARTYDTTANPQAAAFVVNTHTYGDQYSPRIAATPGSQVVVWTSLGQDGSREGVFGQALSNGAISGGEFPVNTTTYLRQFQPDVAADNGGRFLAVWSSYQTTAGFDVFGQRYLVP
jgi:hypothetical protein